MVEIVFVLDRSSSMSGLEESTIDGFNSMLRKQKKEEGRAVVSTVLFDSGVEVIHDRVDIDRVRNLTRRDYRVRGCTALLDAVGNSIDYISLVHRKLHKLERPRKTLFVIITDGMENASVEYSYKRVRGMIEKEKHGWEFIFLGANIDTVGEAERFGIDESMAVNYNCDDIGTALNYEAICEAMKTIRTSKKNMSSDWRRKIDKDYESRSKK